MAVLFIVLALLGAPASARAQQADSVPADTIFLRAQRLASEGDGAAGRTLIDSILAATPEGSPRYAEALYWHASLAETAADAERDYRRLSVEFPLSPRAEDALMRLAQLEMARGDRALALRHLERLVLEHPASAQIPRAHYWEARVLLEDSNLPRACAALERARAGAAPTDIELRNQIEFYGKRCYGVDTAAVATRPAAAESTTARRPARTPPARSTADSAQRTVVAQRPPLADSGGVAESAPADSARSESAATAPATPPAPTGTPPATRTGRSSGKYTVQVAAFNTRSSAAQLRDRLAARGYQARVVGSAAPFRVRVGYYATYAQARAMADQMRTKNISALAVDAESR
jgi:cell division septation protein DedD